MWSAPLVELLHAFSGCRCNHFSFLMRQKWSVIFMHMRWVSTLQAPLDEHGCFKQKHAGKSWHFTPLTSFKHFSEREDRCYKCFLATAPCKRFPLCSVCWELPPFRRHGLQQCTTCLVPEIHSNSPDSSSWLLHNIGRSASKTIRSFCLLFA